VILRAAMLVGSGNPAQDWTYNPADKGANAVLSNGNRTLVSSSGHAGARSTASKSSGKVYVEPRLDTDGDGDTSCGICVASSSLTGGYIGFVDSNAWGYLHDGSVRSNTLVDTYDAYTAGDVIGLALDSGANKLWFSKNGVWQSGGPEAGSGGLTISASTFYIGAMCSGGTVWSIPVPTTYAVPGGFGTL
jgi:hypothetical protein